VAQRSQEGVVEGARPIQVADADGQVIEQGLVSWVTASAGVPSSRQVQVQRVEIAPDASG
jgi:hypothetical protein